MLVLNPRTVRFGSAPWEGVTAVVIDREAARQVTEWDDHGPHAVMVDVPERRVTVRVAQPLAAESLDAPLPGEEGELSFLASPAATGAGRRRVRMTAVVVDVTHEVSERRGAVRTITLIAVSARGDVDPVSVELVEGS